MKLSNSLYYLAFALTMFFFVLVFIPRSEIKKIFWFALLWGSGVDLLLIFLFKLLHLYHYIKAAPFEFYGSPILINLAWSAAVMLFIHFLPERREKYVIPLYIGMFGVIGVFIGVFLKNAGLIVETHWNELFRFPVITLWLFGCYLHYQFLKKRDSHTI